MYRIVRCAILQPSATPYYRLSNSYSNGNESVALSPNKQYKRVSDYYVGKSVLITGATGFLGKVFIERLLYNCTDIGNIFVLIRPKKGMSIQQRVEEMTNIPLFEKLKQIRPADLNKIVPIEGDMTAPELGIKPADQETLINKVAVVFHSAATVRFADPIKTIMNVNYKGTRKVLDLTKKIKKLDTFVYISTAFSNSDRIIIDEVIYPPHKKLQQLAELYETCDESQVEKLLDGIGNSYASSKALCETMVHKERHNMPIVIVRPSIVTPMIKDPLPGWADTWVAATALYSDAARGYMPIIYGNENIICDFIPVDYVCNLAIIAAAKGNRSTDNMVYNICSSSINPITWKHSSDLFLKEYKEQRYGTKVPSEITLSQSKYMVATVTFLLKYIPSLFKDIGSFVTGKNPRYLKESSRSDLLLKLIKPFTTKSWIMKSNNTQNLIASLDEHDKKVYPCNVSDIIWSEYMPIFCQGVKKFLQDKIVK